MSPNRQLTTASGGPTGGIVLGAIVVDELDLAPGEGFAEHAHAEHQLVWSAAGVVVARIDRAEWSLPPDLALWVPAGTAHEVAAAGAAEFFGVYLHPRGCPIAWRTPTVVRVDALMREILLRLARPDLGRAARVHLQDVLYDLITPTQATVLRLPLPTDERALHVARGIVDDPASTRDLDAWARDVFVSGRTLARLFAAETGMTFSTWRTAARMRASVALLSAGLPVSTVASRVGYRTASAFVVAFRRATGHTPGAYFSSGADDAGSPGSPGSSGSSSRPGYR